MKQFLIRLGFILGAIILIALVGWGLFLAYSTNFLYIGTITVGIMLLLMAYVAGLIGLMVIGVLYWGIRWVFTGKTDTNKLLEFVINQFD